MRLFVNAKFIFALATVVFLATQLIAQIEPQYVEFSESPNAFKISANKTASPIVVDTKDFPRIIRAASDLQEDIKRVSDLYPQHDTNGKFLTNDVILAGTMGKSRFIDELIKSKKISVKKIKGHWEAYQIQVVENPFANSNGDFDKELKSIKRALVITGSDKRGTIYGLYDISQQIGVSPWYWWADVPVHKHSEIYVPAKTFISDSPKIKYRGIFLNDEAPSLSGWATEKFGGFNHKFYTKVFELLLRLKANYLWTAMWGNAFYDDDKENAKFAHNYGIVIGTSHHEPMQRAHDEWRRYGKGAWDYTKNGEVLKQFWTDGVRRAKGFESIITLGMRGDGDEPMSREANTALLEKIVADQRKIIAENINPNLTEVPQMWCLYKEVQEYYEKGMRVPDDVTLLWSDDNWGNIRRLPTPEERKRSGGAGVYYHFDYVGGPRNYKWLNTVPITKIWEQMNLAYNYDARKIWIVNVGDLKPMEFPIEFFLRQAWNPEQFNADNLADYTKKWAEREFGKEFSIEIAGIISKYTKFNYRRKPELLEPTTYSLTNYSEAERIVKDYNDLAEKAERIYSQLPSEKKDAFYQLILYPTKACANLNELYFTVGKNRLYAVQGRNSTNYFAEKARQLFQKDAELSKEYNEILAGGKWNHFMDQTHIGYTYWQQPPRNAMPAVQEVQIPQTAEFGVTLEGFEPRTGLTLPEQNIFDKQPRYFEVFNMGQTSVEFTVEAKESWIKLSQTKGNLETDQRIWVSVDWNAVPIGKNVGTISISGSNGQKFTINVPVFKPANANEIKGFVETNGYLSIEAEHFTRSIEEGNLAWKVLPDFGRTLSGVTLTGNNFSPIPITENRSTISPDSPRLEYEMYLFKEGEVNVDLIFAPTQMFQPGDGFRFAVSFDDEKPKIINFHEGYNQKEWEKSVADGVRIVSSKHTISKSGNHTLKFWAIDSGLILEKMVVNTGGLKPSYLGPPESFRR